MEEIEPELDRQLLVLKNEVNSLNKLLISVQAP